MLFYEGHPHNVIIKNTLIIIAHPDDDSMFFTPVILSLRKFSSQVFILCLSEGSTHTHTHIYSLISLQVIIMAKVLYEGRNWSLQLIIYSYYPKMFM